jgi:hypothetical protein
MANPDPPDDKYYYDSTCGVHTTPQEAVEACLQNEAISGQYVTGGNCGQDPSNIPDDKG